MPFTDGIKSNIANAHVFMPLITENSQKRPWVHQETGYAMGINVPVLPVAVGDLPGEMIAQLQAIAVNTDLSDFVDRLQQVNLEQVVFPPPPQPLSMFEVAEWPETRAELMSRHVERLRDLAKFGRVRHRGSLSSFSLPDRDINHPIWDLRDGIHPRTDYSRHLLRRERQGLEQHARACGCSLLIDPTLDVFNQVGPHVRRARLETLREFLSSMTDDKIRIVMSPRARAGNLIIVGDWFAAESQVPRAGQGYRQTVFSCHAPTVLRLIRRFDQEFEELYASNGLGKDAAINEIDEILKPLPPCESGNANSHEQP
jgi:hypothetical protein